MNQQDIRSLMTGFLVTFVVAFGLSSWGPLSGDGPVGRRLVMSLVLALVVSAVLEWSARRQAKRPVPEVVLDEATATRVDELLDDGKKVTAVKVVRDATGADLRSALTTVETRERGTASVERH